MNFTRSDETDVMTNTPPSVVTPDVLNDNKMSIHNFLRDSYTQVKSNIQHGFSAFREEVLEMYEKAESCFSIIASPVNNFLKDCAQIDTELMQEVNKECNHFFLLNGTMVPVEQVLSGPMEENY